MLQWQSQATWKQAHVAVTAAPELEGAEGENNTHNNATNVPEKDSYWHTDNTNSFSFFAFYYLWFQISFYL